MSEECPQCGFELKDFYKNKIENEIKEDFEKQKQKLFEKLNNQLETNKLEIHSLKNLMAEKETLIREKIKQEMKSEFNSKEIEYKRSQIQLKGQIQNLENNKRSEISLTVAAQLQEQRSKLLAEFQLGSTEKNTEIDRLNNLIKELETKSLQGSQQAKGEVGEILIENTLKLEFPIDKVIEVAKGINGADVSHYIRDNHEREIGLIYIESKNAKKFSSSWISKLKNDMKNKNASYGVLVTLNLPENIKQFEEEDLFICGFHDYLLAIKLLRGRLIDIAKTKIIDANKKDKSSILYEYVTGKEFAQWMRGMLEYMSEQKIQLEKDKRQFSQSIAVREKQIEKIISSHETLKGHFRGLGSPEDFALLENFSEEN